jgi:alkylation response protein AidB-like acyl-CoA dehydrogenase
LLTHIVDLAKRNQINGKPAYEDPAIRQQLAQFACEVAAKKYSGMRSLTKRLKGLPPGAEASISKMVSTELSQRMVKYATRLLGEYALLERRSHLAPEGDWLRRILASESMTIAGGTSAVQRNMIGERILGLPKG